MYSKLFTKILDSSIWLEDNSTRIVWVTMLAAMDEDGFCQFASVANLAHRSRVERSEAEKAVECLESPDENSSDPENDGRRIERVPGGWMVLNAAKYRDLVTREIAKARCRQRVARHRENKCVSPQAVTPCNADVTPCNADVTVSNGCVTQSEADTDTKAETEAKADSPPPLRPAEAGKGVKEASEILDFLNKTAGREFRPIDTNLDPIRHRLKEPGVTPEGCRQMITRQVKMWGGDRMAEFLRPTTLFGKEKFASYYDNRALPPPNGTHGTKYVGAPENFDYIDCSEVV